MIQNLKKTALAGLLFATSSSASLAEEILIPVEKDASVIRQSLCCSQPAEKNFGKGLTVDAGQYHHTSQALLGFSLDSLPAAAVIRKAELVLGSARLVGSSPASFDLGSSADSWDEFSVTWNSRPSSSPVSEQILASGINTIDVTSVLVTALDADQKHLTFTLDAKGSANIFISSKEDLENPASFLRLDVESPGEPAKTKEPAEHL